MPVTDEEFRQHLEAWKRNNHFHAQRITDMKAEEDRLNKEINRLRRLIQFAAEGLQQAGDNTGAQLIKNAIKNGSAVNEREE